MTDRRDFPTPARTEKRGTFPEHPDPPRHARPLTGPEALAIARQNLADWIAEHGDH